MTGRPGKLGRVWDELWATATFYMGFSMARAEMTMMFVCLEADLMVPKKKRP